MLNDASRTCSAIGLHFSQRGNCRTSYTRARDVVDEVVDARMLLGVHFRSADEDGSEIGRRIARQIRGRFFKRAPDSE